ncbi:MAG: hypothetical protein QW392_04560 [Candidatus Jordarchaeales archaeon]
MRAGVHYERKVLEAGGFKEEEPVDGLKVYVHEEAYKYLPSEVHLDYLGYWRGLRVTNYVSVRRDGTC